MRDLMIVLLIILMLIVWHYRRQNIKEREKIIYGNQNVSGLLKNENEIRSAVNSINAICRKIAALGDSYKTEPLALREVRKCYEEMTPYMNKIEAIWQTDPYRYGRTKVLTPDGQKWALGQWMTYFHALTNDILQSIKQYL